MATLRLARCGHCWPLRFGSRRRTWSSPRLGGCTLTPDIRDPSVSILKCGDDLTIRSAADTRYHLADQQGLVGDTAPKDAPKSVQLDSGALMIEFKPSEGRRNFQIRTPHAIAAVRGTTWAVEVEPDKTSR